MCNKVKVIMRMRLPLRFVWPLSGQQYASLGMAIGNPKPLRTSTESPNYIPWLMVVFL